MEKRIKNHEELIKKELKKGKLSLEMLAYHRWMVANFQHERLVHLIVMMTFVVLSLGMLGISCWLSCFFAWSMVWPFYLATLIMIIVSIFYVKHYYFLENHIQKLYDLVPCSADKS